MATASRTALTKRITVSTVTMTLSRDEAIALFALLRRVRESPNASDGKMTAMVLFRSIKNVLYDVLGDDIDVASFDSSKVVGGAGSPVRTDSLAYVREV
jgi:hypothetical protein